jgi:hypothetical protein
VAVRRCDNIDVFARGAGDRLLHWWSDGGWKGPEDLGGGVASRPTAFSFGAGHVAAMWKGPNGQLYERAYTGGAWTAAKQIGGALASAPVALASGNSRVDVFYRGTAGTLQSLSYVNNAWGTVKTHGTRTFVGTPAVASWGPGRIDVFARGNLNTLAHWWFGNYAFAASESLQGTVTSDPSVVSRGENDLHIVYRGANDGVYLRSWTGAWLGEKLLGGLTASAAPFITSWGPLHLGVFARGLDNALHFNTAGR